MSNLFDSFYYIIERFDSFDAYQEKREKMKKIVAMTLVSAVSMLLVAGCSTKSGVHTAEHSFSGGYELALKGHPGNKRLHDAIVKAGESTGWNMTEFKSTALIAEKINGDESITATISFYDDKIIIMQDSSTSGSSYDSDVKTLLGAINEAIQDEETR